VATTESTDTTRSRPAEAGETRPDGLVTRFVGMILSPRATLERLTLNPLWLGMLLVTTIATGAATWALLATDVGQ
jgi:hypothetical protein